MPPLRSAVAAGLLLCSSAAHASLPSRPSGPVLDLTGTLNQSHLSELDGICRDLEASGKAVLVVAIVPTLDGDSIEGYAVRLFKEWGIGSKETNNGVLLLVSTGDRKVRIETGYGVESILPDGRCGEIIRREIIPFFKRGAAADGVLRGAREIGVVLARGQARTPRSALRWSDDTRVIAMMALLLAVGGLLAGFGFTNVILGRGWGMVVGFAGCGAALFAGYFVAKWLAVQAAIVIGGAGGAAGCRLALPKRHRSSGGRGGGGWHGSGGWGGGFGGGGGSFGGFGGGFSGGGGASGSW